MSQPSVRKSARPRLSSFRPSVEFMESRIVLNAAPLAAAAKATVTPVAAQKQILGTAATTLKQYASLQAQLVTLAGKMNNLQVGAARQPIVRQATSLVKTFLKQEGLRYKKFETFNRTAPKTSGVANAASIERTVHQKALVINRQVAWFGWAGYTKFTLVSPVQSATIRNETQGPIQSGSQGRVQAQSSQPITTDEANLALLYLESALANIHSKIRTAPPSGTIDARQMQENASEQAEITVAIGFIGAALARKASPEAWESFKDQLKQTFDATTIAIDRATEVTSRCSTSTFVPAGAAHMGVKATPPLEIPDQSLPVLP